MRSYEELVAASKAIRKVLDAGAEAKLRAIAGVVHVSVGLKERDGQLLKNQLCIRVYVKRKKSRHELSAAELIPVDVEGIPTDVNMIGEFDFHSDNTRYRPIKSGIEITNRIIDLDNAGSKTRISAGTLGCIAVDQTDNVPVLLSNWHVLFANTGQEGDKVFQPAPTSLPALSLSDLPFRPSDDADRIAVIRRNAISQKVDGAIAAIDISSCCRCCGIHYSNEINGLSIAGRPPRNTIVGDQPAVSGMTVFKVGRSTLRTEGLVIDDKYPSFSITLDGTTYTFDSQIAIQNVDQTLPFSGHGDSGSVVISLDNKIVGLVFGGGRNVTVGGVIRPFVSIANHIADVLSELKIRIEYSSDVVLTAATTSIDLPRSEEQLHVPEFYRAFREHLESHEQTALIINLGRQHQAEVAYLVNHCRPVTVTWRRSQGPAWLAAVIGAVRDGHYKLPPAIKGVTLEQALGRMRAVLSQHGSAELNQSLRRTEADELIKVTRNCGDVNEMVEHLTSVPESVDLGVLNE